MRTAEELDIIYVNYSKYGSDWHSIPHTHSFAEILYVLSGNGELLVRDRKISIREDDLIIVNPHIEHTEMSRDKSPLEYIVIGLSGIVFEMDKYPENTDYIVSNYRDYKHNVLLYVKSLLLEYNMQDSFSKGISKNLLEVLIANIQRHTEETFNIISITQDKKIKKDCVFLENYINKHFKEEITLDKLSEITYLSKYYLAHIFKAYKNQSIMAFLTEKRLDEAKFLLETSSLNISQISQIVGFNSQSYFTQVFRQNIGISPKQYRNRMKEKTN